RQLQKRPGARAGDPRTAWAMSVSAYTVAFSPLIPWVAIAAFAGVALLVLAFGAWRRARGIFWRAAAVVILLAVLTNPALVEERRTPRREVAVVVIDESPSQTIGDRASASEAALAALRTRLAQEPGLDVRVVRAGKPQPGGGDDGTRLFTALNREM